MNFWQTVLTYLPWVLVPEGLLVVLGSALFLMESFRKKAGEDLIYLLALVGTAFIFLSTLNLNGLGLEFWPARSVGVWGGAYLVSPDALFFKRFFLVTLFVVIWMAREYASLLPHAKGEFPILMIFCTAGLCLVASAQDFVTLFVGLEVVTISLYVLVAYQRDREVSLEAGIKYLIIGALSTGFLVYGLAFIFGTAGTLNLISLAAVTMEPSPSLLFGLSLVLAAIGFKVAAVPFHVWAPDVYQGAPTPVTALLAVGSKAAGFVVLLRLFYLSGAVHSVTLHLLFPVLSVVAAATLVLGTLTAFPQRDLKRLLAYSGIGHAGFILMAGCVLLVQDLAHDAALAVIFYLASYLMASLPAFLILCLVARDLRGEEIRHLYGLSRRNPGLAFSLLIAVLSMAGIPPLVGFGAKLSVVAILIRAAEVHPGFWWLLAVTLICAAAGLFYYLGIVRAMFWQEPQDDHAVKVSVSSGWLIGIATAMIIMAGVWPAPLAELVSQALKNWGAVLIP